MSFDDRSSTLQGNGTNTERQSQPPAPASQCRTNCGFYAGSNFDGLCSKCFKLEKLKQTNCKNVTTQMQEQKDDAVEASSSNSNVILEASGGSETVESMEDLKAALVNISETTAPSLPVDSSFVAPSLDSESTDSGNAEVGVTDLTTALAATSDAPDAVGVSKPKKNKCSLCNKKVGLLGFTCRCEGLFCSNHRYSDTHDCKFNYKEHGQDQIRKNNPVVVGTKITKI